MAPPPAPTSRSYRGFAVGLLLVLHSVCAVGLVTWNFLDPRLEPIQLWQVVLDPNAAPLPPGAMWLFQASVWLSLATGLGLVTAVFWGPLACRSIKYAAALIVCCAVWLSVQHHWQQVSWWGHRQRIQPAVSFLEQIAADLTQDWPNGDGQHPRFGPFMAYPIGRPSTLILLKPAATSEHRMWLAAIDRDPRDGTLRFELSDGFQTLWLEHPNSLEPLPGSFTNGIGAQYDVETWIKVNPAWRLSRYR